MVEFLSAVERRTRVEAMAHAIKAVTSYKQWIYGIVHQTTEMVLDMLDVSAD